MFFSNLKIQSCEEKKNIIKHGSIGESEQVHICSVGLVALGVGKGELFTSKHIS